VSRNGGAGGDPRGTLYLAPHGALFVGSDIVNEPHRHFTASLCFSPDGEFRVRADGTAGWQSYRGLLVAPNVEQEMDARGCLMAILQIDPETDAYARIAHRFDKHGKLHALPDELTASLAAHLAELLGREPFDPIELWERVVASLEDPTGARRSLDPRIQKVLDILKQDFLAAPTAGALAEKIGLSEGRLIHLFSEQMGLPLRRYVLWLRLRDVLLSLAEGASLTEAAHAAGFADSAHMSRTFRDMFGVRPSLFLKNQRGVAVVFALPGSAAGGAPHFPVDAERWQRVRAAIEARARGGARGP
jgi:AraC-like DNA-binding protein